MSIIDLQIVCAEQPLPDEQTISQWCDAALTAAAADINAELTVRVVEPAESQQLNSQYRGKDKPTNVLSFPFEAVPGIPLPLIGDLIVCADVVKTEAQQQHKPLMAHWAHMIVHGTLHLLGYDHIEESEAEQMEALEIKIMAQLGIANPYQEQ